MHTLLKNYPDVKIKILFPEENKIEYLFEFKIGFIKLKFIFNIAKAICKVNPNKTLNLI
jgi:hypothetical protein